MAKSTRRRFLLRTLGAVFGLSVGGAIYSLFLEPSWILTTRRTIRIPGLSKALVGKRIVHLTDLHLGAASPLYVERCARLTMDLKPDLVALTGDYTGNNRRHQAERVADILSTISAPLGVFATSGNHDFGVYHSGGRPHEPLALPLLADRGISVIDNQVRAFGADGERTWLVGLGDLWAKRCLVEETMKDLPPDEPRIVLSHNPDSIFDIVRQGADLVLSGHTHGGQVDLPLFGPPLLPVKNRQYYSGLYQVTERTRLYVSNGLGYLIRVRFNARPEIAVHDLSG
jgi:uncharacterized protein